MLDRDKAIVDVEEAFNFVSSELDGLSDFDEKSWNRKKEKIIAMLKDQDKLVKATKFDDGIWICGECGHPVYPRLMERYCPGCGKKVDYSE